MVQKTVNAILDYDRELITRTRILHVHLRGIQNSRLAAPTSFAAPIRSISGTEMS